MFEVGPEIGRVTLDRGFESGAERCGDPAYIKLRLVAWPPYAPVETSALLGQAVAR
jgi:hypothetical protein